MECSNVTCWSKDYKNTLFKSCSLIEIFERRIFDSTHPIPAPTHRLLQFIPLVLILFSAAGCV